MVIALMAGSCSLGDSAETASINVYLDVNPSVLTVGDGVMTITATARNVGYDPLSLTGPSDCLLYLEVRDSQGTVVWHSNRECVGQTVTEELPVGQDKVQTFIWDGTGLAGSPLGVGLYYIRAVARLTNGAYAGPPVSVSLD
jgi:hypothetical protein